MDAFITAASAVLPGPAVANDDIESVLGALETGPSRLLARILRNNGIETRHYAIDRETHQPTHSSAQLAAQSVRAVCDLGGVQLTDVDLLACATSVPDQVVPGHASMVHGELGSHACEIVTTHGVCCAGMTALKYAVMAVRDGSTHTAVANAVERTSSFLRAPHFSAELKARTRAEEADPNIAFDQEFLRWMLSDGAGAVLVQGQPAPDRLSLRVEWIELVSFAHELPTCMYMGGQRTASGGLLGWRDTDSLDQALRGGFFNLHQDVKVLSKHIIEVTVTRTLEQIRKRRDLRAEDIDWMLPHYSSEYFRQKSFDGLARAGFEIPYEKWCSNLVQRGNTGCASILIMLADFLDSGRLNEGDAVLLIVPESGRFSSAWALLRAVRG